MTATTSQYRTTTSPKCRDSHVVKRDAGGAPKTGTNAQDHAGNRMMRQLHSNLPVEQTISGEARLPAEAVSGPLSRVDVTALVPLSRWGPPAGVWSPSPQFY
jgi:hypothetical protein